MQTELRAAVEGLRERARAVIGPREFSCAAPLGVRVHQCAERIGVGEAAGREFVPVGVGWRWGPVWSTAWFEVRGEVPREMKGKRVVMRFDCGTEALVWDGGVPRQGLDRNRDAVELFERAGGGERVGLMVEAACNHPLGVATAGLFWEPPEFHKRWEGEKPGELSRCELAVFDEGVWRVGRMVEFALGLAGELGGRAAGLLRAVEGALGCVERGDGAGAAGVMEGALRGGGGASRTRCFAVGHAHLDTAWLWPVAESRRKCLRTFATALRNMERFGGFRFLCSQAQHYAWAREMSPGLFREIAERVREGRWEAMGGMWVEPDGNLPSGESFVRQILHGTRFWEGVFGERGRQRLAYLPDTFGFAASLPQIFRLAGLDTFITNKLWWNETTEFPYTHFLWRGIDGTEIVSHVTPGKEYNATNTPRELLRGQEVAERKGSVGVWLQPYGFGDGGGGPTDWNIVNAELAGRCEGLASTDLGGAGAFCAALHDGREALRREGRDLPVWEGELYLERHRGTYTTQAGIKQRNARAEAGLRVAEWLTFAGPVAIEEQEAAEAAERLDGAWKKLLVNQFHDILPGSSIGEVYEDAAEEYDEVEGICRDLETVFQRRWWGAVDTRGMREPLLVFNPGSSARGVAVEWFDRASVLRRAYAPDVPALGVRVIDAAEPGGVGSAVVRGNVLSNGLIEAVIDGQGRITSLKRCGASRDVVGHGPDGRPEPINQLVLYEDRPRAWEAWDIDAEYLESAEPVASEVTRWEAQGEGHCATIRVERPLGRGSRIGQSFELVAGEPVLRIATDVDWHEERRLLRALFPVAVRAAHATYEIPFGHIQRPTTAETPRERAMFEVPGQRWMDLSEPGLGLALLTDCKYGYSCRGNVMGVSLLRSPKWPDPEADMGGHKFVYGLLPHDGDWRAAGVDREGERMIRGAWSVALEPGRPGTIKGAWAPLTVEAGGGAAVRVAAIKRAEEGGRLIVRLVESHGRGGECRIRWGLGVGAVEAVDLLERPMALPGFAHEGGRTRFPLRPFQIVTLAVRVG